MPAPVSPDDLESLLEQLNSDTPPVAAQPSLVEQPAPVVIKPPQAKPKKVLSSATAVQETKTEVVATVEDDKPVIDPAQIMADFDKAAVEIIKKVNEDRGRARSIMIMCEEAIRPNDGPANHEAPRIFLESMVKALEVASNATTTEVKVLDSRSKMIVALKGQIGVGVSITNTVATDSELIDLLNQPAIKDLP